MLRHADVLSTRSCWGLMEIVLILRHTDVLRTRLRWDLMEIVLMLRHMWMCGGQGMLCPQGRACCAHEAEHAVPTKQNMLCPQGRTCCAHKAGHAVPTKQNMLCPQGRTCCAHKAGHAVPTRQGMLCPGGVRALGACSFSAPDVGAPGGGGGLSVCLRAWAWVCVWPAEDGADGRLRLMQPGNINKALVSFKMPQGVACTRALYMPVGDTAGSGMVMAALGGHRPLCFINSLTLWRTQREWCAYALQSAVTRAEALVGAHWGYCVCARGWFIKANAVIICHRCPACSMSLLQGSVTFQLLTMLTNCLPAR